MSKKSRSRIPQPTSHNKNNNTRDSSSHPLRNDKQSVTSYIVRHLDNLDYYDFSLYHFKEFKDEAHCQRAFASGLDIIGKDGREEPQKRNKAIEYFANVENIISDNRVRELFEEKEMREASEYRAIQEKKYSDNVAASFFEAKSSRIINKRSYDSVFEKLYLTLSQRPESDRRTKIKKRRDYLVGDAPKNLKIPTSQQMKTGNGDSITEALLKYRESSIDYSNSNKKVKHDTQELSLNCMFLIEDDQQDEYGLHDSMWDTIKRHINEKYFMDDEVDATDQDSYDEYRKDIMRPIFKLAKNNLTRAKIESNKAVAEALERGDPGYNMMAESLRDLITGLSKISEPKDLNEDLFSNHLIKPAIIPYLPTNKYTVLHGCEHESNGSKKRRGGAKGRIPDLSLETTYKDNSQMIFTTEIKSPIQVRNGGRPDFVKLCNIMKDETDSLIKSGYGADDIIVYGMTVEGFKVKIYTMDLSYAGLYFVFPVNTCLLPVGLIDLSRMDDVSEVFMDINNRLKKSINAHVREQRSQDKERDCSPNRKLSFVVPSFSSPKRFESDQS